mgnify:CR=1 FL=1
MPVNSSFFPKQALQGEDLPSHMIWSDLTFDCIKIIHSKALAFKEVFNVSDKDIIVKENSILINKVEVDGYLGIVYSSRILPTKASDEKIEYSFLLENDVVESLTFGVHLFRPDIMVHNVPHQISVNPVSEKISSRILVKNLGEGTAVIDIETTPESEAQKHYPKFFENFIQEFLDGIKSSISRLKSDFKQHSSLLDKLEIYLTKPFRFDDESLKMFEKFENELSSAFEENEQFAKGLVEMLAGTILRSTDFSNVYQFVLDYVNSIRKEKILLRDPFNVISLVGEPVILRVKIDCIDLLKQKCESIELPPISVLSEQSGEIALFKLFQWGEE